MKNVLRKIFAPPVFPDDEDKTRSAAVLNFAGWSIAGVDLVVLLLVRPFLSGGELLGASNLILFGIVVLTLLALYVSHRGYVKLGSFIVIALGWIGLTSLTVPSDGIRDAAFMAYILPILMAGLLLGWRWAIGFIVLSILSGWALAYAEVREVVSSKTYEPYDFALIMTGVFAIAGSFVSLMVDSLQKALNKSRATTQELSFTNKELSALQIDLEKRVEERTSEIEKRASQLEAVSSVARAIASVQDLDALLPAITKLISQQFGFYHIGIFLLDEKRENAILRASNSEGGMQLLGRQHSLPVDRHSLVGYSILRSEPRIALDVGSDSMYFSNPDLPETRSEIALPLRVTGQVIGSLDVQSTQTNAFSEGDINVLTTLADQVAIAIENARLFGEARTALNESRSLFERYTQQEWGAFARQARQTGFVFDGKQVLPLDKNNKRETAQVVAQTGSLSLEKESDSIGVPIRLRGQTIGVLDVRTKRGARQWKQEEISILEAAAERAALALENARLVQTAQRRAARERAIGDISAKIGAVSNLESILQTAVEELGRKIGGATEVSLEIGSDDGQNDR
ncbi:MAG TPA: GAF domain-containing protein [Anaerolineales bacterium]|nr:GAF domain-containing protein [Anaerolineales bacterium]